MKNFMILVICLAVFVGLFVHIRNQQTVTHEEFQTQIDSLKMQLSEVMENQDTMKLNLDSLKAGQRVIYNAVKDQDSRNQENNNKTFLQKLNELWRN